jgi:Zn-dependent protease/predicted transcriptional regulator
MGWSLNIGKIFGIRFRIHITFFLLVAFIFVSVLRDDGLKKAFIATAFICAVFACVLIHEIGHSLIALLFGKRAKSITLLPIGGIAALEELPEKPLQEIAMAIIGPLINLAIAALIFLFIGSWTGIGEPNLYPDSTRSFFAELINVNIFLALFNLIPAFPMDGGRVLRGVLALKLNFLKATNVAVIIGQAFATLFIFIGLFTNWWLALIGLFLYLGAGSEKQQTVLRSYLHQVPVKEAMTTEFVSLSPDALLSTVLQHFHHGLQENFPVIDNQKIIGILTKDSILSSLREKDLNIPVWKIMDTDFVSVSPDTSLDNVYKLLLSTRKNALIVTDQQTVVGIISLDGISRFFMVRSALNKSS